jgi:glyoxylase-like metal-dependent hydrolase (beta-lactamase superfamily II)
MSPDFREDMTAIRQIEQLGFQARDVQHVVLTHLDFDHAGGLDDFPFATVHMMSAEREAALAQKTLLDRMRYRPQQWSTKQNWRVHASDRGDRWFGFECVRDITGLGAEILFIPLLGHTLGHAGVAIRNGNGWMLQAGDAYFYHEEMNLEHPTCTPGLRFYQWLMEKDRTARLSNQARLRSLKRDHGDQVQILCSHDTRQFEDVAHHSAATPAFIPT